MRNVAVLAFVAVLSTVSGCSSSPPVADSGAAIDKGGPTTDKGGPAIDKGGPSTDKGSGSCDPSFGQAQACGGDVVGNWKYTAGCVADAAFDELKKDCPGVQVSGITYNMGTGNHVAFLANGTFTRLYTGSVSGKALFGTSCTALGCAALEGTLKLALLAKYPGSTVTCTAVATGGCDCAVQLQLAGFAVGTYKTSGGVLTATALGVDYPFYYCLQGTRLVCHGTPQNTNDHNVTYLLEPAP